MEESRVAAGQGNGRVRPGSKGEGPLSRRREPRTRGRGGASRAGWNVKFVTDVNLAGHSDEDVFAFAHRDDRILLTHDTDFLDDRRFPLHRNPGVVVLPGGSGDEEALVGALGQALSIVGRLREFYRKQS